MKLGALVTIGLVAAATPALAGGTHRQLRISQCQNLSVNDQECVPGQRADRNNVYSYDGRLIGRDPDPNVRMQLRDEDARFRLR